MMDDRNELLARIAELEAAIRAHRDQRADDRCWMDDQTLYAVLGDRHLGDNRVGDKAAMLKNCERFIEQRCEGGGWQTYAELEERVRALLARLSNVEATIVELRDRVFRPM